jgi:hypothetical protein
MPLTTASLNQALDAITVTQMSLHNTNPTAAGNVGEISGGGYARQTVTFGAAASGVRNLSGTPTFNVAAGTTVSHYVIWDGATVKEFGAFTAPETFGNAGTYRVTSGSISLTAS